MPIYEKRPVKLDHHETQAKSYLQIRKEKQLLPVLRGLPCLCCQSSLAVLGLFQMLLQIEEGAVKQAFNTCCRKIWVKRLVPTPCSHGQEVCFRPSILSFLLPAYGPRPLAHDQGCFGPETTSTHTSGCRKMLQPLICYRLLFILPTVADDEIEKK